MIQEKESFWNRYLMQPIKRDKQSYSYILGDVLEEHDLDLENLDEKDIDSLTQHITYLSTPSEEGYHPFGTVPAELSLLKKSTIRSIKKSLWTPFACSLLFLLFPLLSLINGNGDKVQDLGRSDYIFLFGLIIIPSFKALIEYIEIKKLQTENLYQWIEYRRFKQWLGQRKFALSWYLPILIGLFFCWQYGSWDSPLELLALTKPLTETSSYYKLFTVVLVHANFLHAFFNLAALYFLSNMFLQFASYRRLLLVFFFAAITGSVFSILFVPNGTSVGASGAILGLLGFVLAIAIKHRSFISKKFTLRLLGFVGATAALGLFALDIIDNGAHLGGLLGGMAIGFLYSEKSLLNRFEAFHKEELHKHEKRKAQMEAEISGIPLEEVDFSEDAPPSLR